ncbi:tryptophan synthase subunit alpha, partial [bacterium AH-315-B15]|nr:tryptophan synthase subunit alpha [bacterium AH-315-B15]
FLAECKQLGVDGLIIPDISFDLYCSHYEKEFERFDVPLIFLASADSEEQRLRQIDEKTKVFIYLLSSSATTGKIKSFDQDQVEKFDAFRNLNLQNPILLGFGIHDSETFETACKYFNGGIIGSAFIRHLEEGGETDEFILKLRQHDPHLDSLPNR